MAAKKKVAKKKINRKVIEPSEDLLKAVARTVKNRMQHTASDIADDVLLMASEDFFNWYRKSNSPEAKDLRKFLQQEFIKALKKKAPKMAENFAKDCYVTAY